jgi:hypothetical protein
MGAPEYSPQRIKFIAKLLADNTPLDKAAQIIGTSKDALRVWLKRHAAAHGIAHTTKVYRRREPSPPQQAQPGA